MLTSSRVSESQTPDTGETRPSRAGASVIRIASWVALLLGVLASINAYEADLVVAATLCGALFAAGTYFLGTERTAPSGMVFQIVSMLGAVLTAASVALTGGIESPFLLLAMMPSLFAAIVGGFRIGLITALLSTAIIAAVATTTAGMAGLVAAAGTIGLFPLMALVVAQIRSLLTEAEARADSLAQATQAAEAELVVLGQANELLHRLTDLYGEGSTNPVDIGRTVIQAIVETHPGSFATATLFDTQGPVVVARAGTDSASLIRNQFPLGDGETTSGVVSIATPDPMTAESAVEVKRLLRPLSVSFANAFLLQQIAGEAVREERLRLARELHDEVGPALASLGLAMDGIALQPPETDIRGEIDRVREGLGDVVDDLRGIIADLRADESGSLSRAIAASVAGHTPPPEVEIEIHERRPPRGPAGRQIVAVVTEAVRNAYRHADATRIRVNGTVDARAVELEVSDDGVGFDPSVLPDGHYGVMGMKERADRIGARLELDSGNAGTTVRVSWKEDR